MLAEVIARPVRKAHTESCYGSTVGGDGEEV